MILKNLKTNALLDDGIINEDDFEIDNKDMLQIYTLEKNQRIVPNLELNESKYPFD